MDSKGIFNIELLIVLIILLIIFSMFISLSLEEFSSVDETENRKEARIIVRDVSQLINEVYINGDGYSRTYLLPSKINSETYILQINNSGVYVNSHYQLTFANILPNDIFQYKKIYLEPGNVYEFININNTVQIK